ncbi:hypothetical protein EJ07DRAFT_177603 [Lizonia empirigonia]|nr:hypothetical protein EJ07DRAFT_177603 [Lizonia empirigonia]
MDRQQRTSSATSKGLPEQLASIADTLAKASQRRDAEVKKLLRPSETSTLGTGQALTSKPAPLTPVNHPDRICSKTPSAQLDGATSTTSESRAGNDRKVSVTTNCDASLTTKRAGGTSHIEDDPRAMLAELRSLRGAAALPDSQDHDESDDVKGMLAELDRLASPPLSTMGGLLDNEPRQMLTEVAAMSGLGSQDVSAQSEGDEESTDDDDDVKMLRRRLQRLRAECKMTPEASSDSVEPALMSFSNLQDESLPRPAIRPDSEASPHVLAPQPEYSDVQWDHARARTEYLFDSELDNHKAQEEVELAVAHAEDALNRIIRDVMDAEEDFRRKEEETKLRRRLIVSNLAAGADLKEIKRQFWEHGREIVNITILPHRDPQKRTKTAHIDMSSRAPAIRASYTTGNVYGLRFTVTLAVKQED